MRVLLVAYHMGISSLLLCGPLINPFSVSLTPLFRGVTLGTANFRTVSTVSPPMRQKG
jgi:hypothetical protein